ncbi:YxeA family protein [Vagococcus elongatus]|uniref:DUF1093 domain-containing protein n=1 Tax=Vagococcus elongatus TaxID=180344 RepID=A0A430AMZ8_9ENTE|nr:YxeA family protein [Vagococcus elongatus]RSU09446.1 hypothetical protein CBF29_11390 [Vagococcus elongatus]
MKKVIVLIGVLILGVVGWKGWDYYQSTYVGKDYFGILEAPLPEETTIVDDSDRSLGQGYKYTVTAFDEDGNSRELNFNIIVSGQNANGSPYEAGTVFKFNASDKRIIEKKVISLDDVPKEIQPMLK